MRRLLPSWTEVAIFATLAIICAAIVSAFHTTTADLRFAFLAGPVFLIASVLGLRRSPAWTGWETEESDDQG